IETIIRENHMTQVQMLGHMPREDALAMLKKSSAQIVPSQWHEPFGLVAIEGFACGKPVIAANVGALVDIIQDGETGFHFEATNPASLAEKVRCLWEQREERQVMARKARHAYETQYASAVNYRQLL